MQTIVRSADCRSFRQFFLFCIVYCMRLRLVHTLHLINVSVNQDKYCFISLSLISFILVRALFCPVARFCRFVSFDFEFGLSQSTGRSAIEPANQPTIQPASKQTKLKLIYLDLVIWVPAKKPIICVKAQQHRHTIEQNEMIHQMRRQRRQPVEVHWQHRP